MLAEGVIRVYPDLEFTELADSLLLQLIYVNLRVNSSLQAGH